MIESEGDREEEAPTINFMDVLKKSLTQGPKHGGKKTAVKSKSAATTQTPKKSAPKKKTATRKRAAKKRAS